MNITQMFTMPMKFKVRISYGKQYGKFKKPGAAKKRRLFKAQVLKLRQAKFRPFEMPPGLANWKEYKAWRKELHVLGDQGVSFDPQAKKALNKYRKRVKQPLIP